MTRENPRFPDEMRLSDPQPSDRACLRRAASEVAVKVNVRRIRESIAIGLIALFIAMAVYSILGLAWTFKAAVEATEKLRRAV